MKYKNKEWLYKKYIIEKLSTCEIAKIFDCSDANIRNWLIKFNIPRRKLKECHTKKYNKGEHPNCIPIKKRFFKYTNIVRIKECWEWTGSKDKDGYGKMKIHGEMKRAHRVSWEIHNNKKIPKGMLICHKCDNPSCVNPYHLFIGTYSENIIDMFNKKRNSNRGGENAHSSKLTWQQVYKIRHLLNNSKKTQQEIANMFKVSKSQIYRIKYNKQWIM